MNSFRLSLHHLFYKGLETFSSNERLLTIYAISLLKPEIVHYKNGILINPNKLLTNENEEKEAKILVRKETIVNGKIEESKKLADGTVKELDGEPFVVRPIPTCHFSLPCRFNKIFIRLEKENTCFLMIKSHTSFDILAALQNGIWSSTMKGNDTIRDVYEEYVLKRKGHVYLFFSVNKSGHLCAFAELVSNQIQEMPEIWLEKQKYSS